MNKTHALVSMRKIEPIFVALIIAIVFTGITVVASSAENMNTVLNCNAKTTFVNEKAHADVTLKNPGWVNYDTKAALRINLQKVWDWRFTKTVPSKGNGVWMYDGNNDSYVNAIAKYNSGSSNKILYLFPYTGELNLQTLNLSYNTTRTNYYKSQLSTLYVYPMIDSSDNLSGLTQSQIEKLAENITAKLNSDSNADGLHLDIEPYNDSLITLVKEIRNRTSKPISVAIGISDPPSDLFKSANFVVLMNYGLSNGLNSTPIENYSRIAIQRSKTFLSTANISNGYAMIGVPAVATKNEWEYKKNGTTLNITYSNIEMEDYLTAALNAKDFGLNNSTEGNYVGISIWAIKSHPGITRKNETVYPYNISDAAWSILKGFGSISVLVKCPNGSVITSGSVWLYNDNYQPVKKQNLNSNGQTTFSNLDPGIYILEVYFDDIFIGSKSEVSVASRQTTSTEITTNPYLLHFGIKIHMFGIPVMGNNTSNILKVEYINFTSGDHYNISITAPNGTRVYYDNGTLTVTNPEIIPINWTPSGTGNHTIEAWGKGMIDSVPANIHDIEVVSPIFELPTMFGTITGIVSLSHNICVIISYFKKQTITKDICIS